MTRSLLVEGWRHLPHSYALVNQWALLELVRVPGLRLLHRDLPYLRSNWRETRGLYLPEQEAVLDGIQAGADGDAILRCSFPFDWTAVPGRRVCVFATSEYHCSQAWSPVPPWLLGRADPERDVLIVTPSRWSRDGFLASGTDPARVVIVPHGADPTTYRPLPEAERTELRSRLRWNEFVFLNVGAMTNNKGIDLLLQAFAVVASRYQHVRLVLKGLEDLYPLQESILKYVDRLPGALRRAALGRLTYVGGTLSMQKLARLYQAADAYVSPYYAEGFNLPVLEAAACGTLVICTAGGPTDDFTRPDFALPVASTLAKVQIGQEVGEQLNPSLDSLIRQMLAAVERPARGAAARQAGPAFVAAGFTWRHTVAGLLPLLFPGGFP